jgi:anti-sigma regulatory factor (Ser/Thr protein kinase)
MERARMTATTGGPISVGIPVTDASSVGVVRRAAVALAQRAGLAESVASDVALVATEAATNIARHAKDGAIFLRTLDDELGTGVEVLATDKGPGIADIARAMRDGFSTGGTSGTGLGAIHRLSADFDLYTLPDQGTVMLAQVRGAASRAPRATPADTAEYGVVCIPYPGELVCGDAWLVERTPTTVRVAVIDGLGHGPDAARAASDALRLTREMVGAPPEDILRAAHEPLRATRGAAMAVATLDRPSASVQFAGVGNIAGTIVSPGGSRSMASFSGIVGHQLGTIRAYRYEWPPNAQMILHSDGLSAKWRPEAYPGIMGHHPSIVAGRLHRDFGRGRDDMTIVVVRDVAR